MMAPRTPLMRQYQEIKKRYEGVLLLFRMGDFYEMFYEDALVGSRILGIALTGRDDGSAGRVPLAGIPVKAAAGYIARLIRAGQKVAICEQVEDPRQAKGLVRREVLEVITPGTVLSDVLLEGKRNNYLAAVAPGERGAWGLAYIDLSTGEFRVAEGEAPEVREEVARLGVAEILLPERWCGPDGQPTVPEAAALAAAAPGLAVTRLPDWQFAPDAAAESLERHFEVRGLAGFGCQDAPAGIAAAGALLSYLRDLQPQSLAIVRSLRRAYLREGLILDTNTLRNLEVLEPLRPGIQGATVLEHLDETLTAMGGRLLRQWLLRPLARVEPIVDRHGAVAELLEGSEMREGIRSLLKGMGDVERLAGRVAARKATPRDLAALREALHRIPALREGLAGATSPLLCRLRGGLEPPPAILGAIDRALVDDPPMASTEGGIVRPGYSAELDELRNIQSGGRDWIRRLETSERSRTGIPSLRVSFNKVFGYYIEVTRPNLHLVAQDYIRKQTISTGERFVTEALKEYEARILTAEERTASLEYELFSALREQVARETPALQALAGALAELDVLAAFALVAERNRYVRPVITEVPELSLLESRHPVVERVLPAGGFIPNDIQLDARSEQIMILTGPNMAGKSTILRQVGLIVLMAQAGSFVPAREATVGLVDRIFTRVGASDSLALGQSTFLVEMTEVAVILHNATARSLILLDEIGRGTSTFDGLSLAWAVTEHLHETPRIAARTIFATHFHEVTDLAALLPRVRNFNVLVKESGDKVVFLRRIAPGGSDRSYGIQVARIAGLPPEVLVRAREILTNLESGEFLTGNLPALARGRHSPKAALREQLSLFRPSVDPLWEEVRARLEGADLAAMTPLEALNVLDTLQHLVRGRAGAKGGGRPPSRDGE